MGWATCALALFNGRKRKAEIGIHMCVRMVRSLEARGGRGGAPHGNSSDLTHGAG
jgi:hypothetical protein